MGFQRAPSPSAPFEKKWALQKMTDRASVVCGLSEELSLENATSMSKNSDDKVEGVDK